MFSKQVARAFALRNGLSQFEMDRAERVDRNNSFLMDLDLIDHDEAEYEVLSAHRLHPDPSAIEAISRRPRIKKTVDPANLRRSNRLKGESPPVYVPVYLGARGYLR